jgi:hypothetical protein
MYDRAFALALRLLDGEEIHLVDDHGRRWRATATCLELELGGEWGPVYDELTTGDVVIEVVRRNLRDE